MRLFTRTTKIIGVTVDELIVLQDLIQQAKSEGKAERQFSSTEVLAIEVSDIHERRTGKR